MRKYFLIIIQFVSVVCAQKQSPGLASIDVTDSAKSKNTDSLHQLLVKTRTDTAKVNLFNLLANVCYTQGSTDSTLWYAQQALNLGQKVNYIRGQFEARTQMAIWLRREGSYPQALQLLLANLQLAEQRKDTLSIICTNWYLAFTYWAMNDFTKVLEYALKNKLLVHSGYFKTQREVMPDSFGYMYWMAEAFEGLNKLDSALYYFQNCYETGLSLKDTLGLVIVMTGLGSTLTKKGHYDEAFSCYRQALSYVKPEDLKNGHSYLGLAKLFNQKKQIDSALYYCRLSLKTFHLLKYPAQELKAVSFMTELFAKQNRTDSAYKYLTLATALKDSLFNQEKVRQVQNLQFAETLREQQIEQEKKEAQQQYETKLKIYSLVGGLVVVLLIAYLLYRNNKQKQKANVLLHEKNKQIESTLTELKSTQAQLIQSEKMASLDELTAGIAHEIQNPLNFVNNFPEVNTELIEELEQEIDKGNQGEVKAIANDVEENNLKIIHHGKRADAIVKGMLQHSRVSTGQKEPTDINKLADEYLRLSYHGMKAKNKSFNATLKTDFDESIGKINIVPQDIGRVLLNLFNNAFYAVMEKKKKVSDGYESTVSVSTKRLNNTVEIHVRDNGVGIPTTVVDKIFQPFFTTKPTGQGTGLGLSLSYDCIKAHGGEIKVESKEGEGTMFTITIKS